MAIPAMRAHAERAAAEGHWIGNHGYTHARPVGQFLDVAAGVAEISKCQELIGELAHDPDPLIRPFSDSGDVDRRVLDPTPAASTLSVDARRYLEEGGFTIVMFKKLPGDFEGGDAWPARAVEQASAGEHSVVVLHDRQFPADMLTLYGKVDPDPERVALVGGALPGLVRFLDLAEEAGLEFVQEPPGDCVPMRAGRPGAGLDDLVTATPVARKAPDFPPINRVQLGLPS
jgi:peptidoglycan/xylan/chitin deacetylase (PgdA/CDA1 family)